MWHLWIVESYNIPSHNNNNPWIFYTIIYKNWLYTIIYTWTVYSQITDVLHHSFRHHPNGVFQCLSLVAEPYSYHLPFVAQLVGQSGDLRPCTKKKNTSNSPLATPPPYLKGVCSSRSGRSGVPTPGGWTMFSAFASSTVLCRWSRSSGFGHSCIWN